MYASVNDPKVTRNTAAKKPPGFITETVFLCVSLFLLKIYSDAAFDALSFVTVLIPIMVFFLLSIVFNILKFIKLLHTEELDEDAGILSPKQIKLLFTVARNLLAYFGVYMISGELDKHITHEELDSLNLGPASASLASAFLIQIILNYQKRRDYAVATGNDGAFGFLGATGLTTVFNALT